jgi:hypothetical protein
VGPLPPRGAGISKEGGMISLGFETFGIGSSTGFGIGSSITGSSANSLIFTSKTECKLEN